MPGSQENLLLSMAIFVILHGFPTFLESISSSHLVKEGGIDISKFIKAETN